MYNIYRLIMKANVRVIFYIYIFLKICQTAELNNVKHSLSV